MNEFDETTAFLGHWGRFQQIIFFLLCASTIPNGLGVLSLVFVAAIPSHHCMIPEVNLTQDWHSAILPTEVVNGKQEVSRCSRYRLDVVRNLSAQGLIPGKDVILTDLEQEACVDGWSYSREIYQSTIVSEYNLVCSEQWKQPFTTTVYFLGVFFGSVLAGHFSDRYGRRPVFFTTMVAQTIFTFAQVFSPSWMVFCILLFLSGFGQIGNYLSAFVLGIETLTGKVRVLFSSLGTCLCFSIGYMTLPLLAYFLRDWRSLVLAVSLPGLLYIPLWWYIPESPRWLVSQGRLKEAEAIVRDAAKRNKVEAPQIIFQDISKETLSKKEERHTFLDLVRTRNIRITTLLLFLQWFSLITGFYALSLKSSQLSADPYISCLISAAVEVPGYISSWLVLQYFPRRPFLTCVTFLGGISLYMVQLVPPNLPALSIVLEMIGKFTFTSSSSLIFVYTAEIYPTVLRNTGAGSCATVSRIGNCSAPFLLHMSDVFQYLPYIALGTLSVLSSFATLFLPETFGKALPETLDQMHQRERLKWPCNTRKDTPEPEEFLESKL